MLDSRNEGQVAILTINRPNRRNALSEGLIVELTKRLHEIEADPAVRATVITGCAPGFCAGSDLKELATMDLRGMCDHEADTGRFCRSIAQMHKPVIAAVSGAAVAGGMELALWCDMRVMEEDATFVLNSVQLPRPLGCLEKRAVGLF
jgi:enoyl-CoA hydratase/carnithine racemase